MSQESPAPVPSAAEVMRASKHAKYQTQNPIGRRLIQGFLDTIADVVGRLEFDSMLDVGCGEGLVLAHLEPRLRGRRCTALDLDPVELADARRNLPWCRVEQGSAYELGYDSGSFELVSCLEVLEHLDDPARALRELARVSSRHVLVSVPREPLWRALNMARGAYLRDWGNTEGHVNHWSARGFEAFVATELETVERHTPTPWTVVLARKR